MRSKTPSLVPIQTPPPNGGPDASYGPFRETVKIALPADQELGRVNEALRADLWREAHEERAELRAQIALYQGKRPDQFAYSLLLVLLCAAVGLALGAAVALCQSDGIDGYRSEGVPVSCWHFRE